jgi:hypothetical protein
LLIPYAKVGIWPSISAILPRELLIKTNLGFEGEGEATSKGCKAWKSVIGPSVLVWKCIRSEDNGVCREGRKEDPIPAEAIIVVMYLILCFSCKVLDNSSAPVSESLESWATRSLLPSALGEEVRSLVSVDLERTAAMTVVSGRRRRDRVRPRPIPVYF